jgi:hypothetical protein
VQFLDGEFFSFLKIVPEDLKHPSYCGPCYDQKVVSSMESYLEIIERAKKMDIFYKNERNVPVIRRSNVKLSVNDCPDRKETLLRLAFLAAEQSYSAVVGVDLSSKKILTAGYQKSNWSATGFPAHKWSKS